MTNIDFFHFVSLFSIQKALSRSDRTMPEETPAPPDRKKIVQYLSQHVHATSPLPKDNHQRKLQTKLDGLFHRLRENERDDDGEENMVEILSQTALTLQEQAERLSMTMSSEKEEEENGNVVEGLHLKACKAYEVAAKMKEACAFEFLLGVR